MNIWGWIETFLQELREGGQWELANSFQRLPNVCLNGADSEVDALVPELIAASQALGNEWAEVYTRHWHNQNLHRRSDARTALKEAVRALEFSHRESTTDCPQSVCSVQDVCLAYGSADGPGFVNERIAVVDEAQARIDPTWGCWGCMASEKATALVDAGRCDEAVEHYETRIGALTTHGSEIAFSQYVSIADYRGSAGRWEAAQELLEEIAPRSVYEDEHDRTYFNLVQARTLLALRRGTEALELLPTLTLVERLHYELRYSEVLYELIRAEVLENNWTHVSTQFRWAKSHADGGSAWDAIQMAERLIRLAVSRGSKGTALAAFAILAQARPELRDPNRVSGLVDELEALVKVMPEGASLPVAPADLTEWVSGSELSVDPELLLPLTIAARKELPNDEALLSLHGQSLIMLGRAAEAAELGWEHLRRDPSSEAAAHAVYEHVANDGSGLQRLVDQIRDSQPTNAQWFLARSAFAAKRWDDVKTHCQLIVQADDSVVNTRSLWAQACRKSEDFQAELVLWKEILPRLGPDHDATAARWDALIPATIVGDWELVRTWSQDLELPVDPGVGPIDEAWQRVLIRSTDDYGDDEDFWALRTGPVTARIVEVNPPWHDQQRHGDVVVFEPAMIDPIAEGSEDTPKFAEIHVLHRGGFTAYEIEGVVPDDDTWATFRDALYAQGSAVWNWSNPTQLVVVESTKESVPALYATVARPESMTALQLHTLLEDLTCTWHQRPYWSELVAEVGDDALVAEHERRAEKLSYAPQS
jgi:tetratricopeptide (TPR) repeat protein